MSMVALTSLQMSDQTWPVLDAAFGDLNRIPVVICPTDSNAVIVDYATTHRI